MIPQLCKQLVLSISPPGFWRRLKDSARSKESRRRFRQNILKRDDYRCVYCGYRSRSNLLHHIDRNPTNNQRNNLETVCTMCHLILHCGFASQVVGILDLYAASKFSQNEIVRLTRKLRAKGVGDTRIKKMLGLKDRHEFLPDPLYLSELKGFISNRIPTDFRIQQALQQMYGQQRRLLRNSG